jgi:hypothetical protein
MPEPQKVVEDPQKIVEVKMMQRYSDCDVNAMLLYVFYLLKHNDDLVLDEHFERDFISKCIYCGCVKEQSGVAIPYFVIPKVSFAIFVHHIVEYFKNDPGYKESYLEQIFVDTFQALQNGLRIDKEKVMIYDEKETTFIRPQRYLNDNDDLKEFIRPFLKLNSKQISKLHKKADNLLLLYNTVKRKIPGRTDLKIFYTLYNNSLPDIPKTLKEKFQFCTGKYRKNNEFCVTKEYVQKNVDTLGNNIDYIDFNDTLIKQFYHFVGLPIRKKT